METKTVEFTRITNDVNGNPRYVFHFLDFLNVEEQEENINDSWEIALKKAKTIGGKTYRGKDFGGGIVFQTDNIYNTIELIENLQKL